MMQVFFNYFFKCDSRCYNSIFDNTYWSKEKEKMNSKFGSRQHKLIGTFED